MFLRAPWSSGEIRTLRQQYIDTWHNLLGNVLVL